MPRDEVRDSKTSAHHQPESLSVYRQNGLVPRSTYQSYEYQPCHQQHPVRREEAKWVRRWQKYLNWPTIKVRPFPFHHTYIEIASRKYTLSSTTSILLSKKTGSFNRILSIKWFIHMFCWKNRSLWRLRFVLCIRASLMALLLLHIQILRVKGIHSEE
jgi:hypothetical protein